MTKTTELLSGDADNGMANVGANASMGVTGLFQSLIGFGAKVQTDAKLETSFKSESLVKTILQNTILTDFLDIVAEEKPSVKAFDDIKIKVIKDSLSYIIMISPYMKMFKGEGLNINTDLDLSIEVNIPGLMDRNAEEIDKQFREMEGLVGIRDINNVMEVYKIGKAPLSFKKSMKAIEYLMPLFSLSEKMLLTISYIFKSVEEVTPLALQKMLYYIQGIHMLMFDEELFAEDCQAWVHGPAYEEVYEVFKIFKYNPIDDIRFAMFQNRFDELSDNEQKVIDLIVDSFGMYSGKALEQITHQETPWKSARKNYLSNEPSHVIISKQAIKKYFSEISEQYDLSTVKGINCYINSVCF